MAALGRSRRARMHWALEACSELGLAQAARSGASLPAAHTDFIFPVVGEELGLVGTVLVLMLFAILVLAIFRLIQITPDRFTQLVAAGVGGMIAIQIITNIGGAIKMLPITGVTLPLLSYGGSSLITTLVAVGFALALSRWVLAGSREDSAHPDPADGRVRQPRRRARPADGTRRPLRQRARSGSAQ